MEGFVAGTSARSAARRLALGAALLLAACGDDPAGAASAPGASGAGGAAILQGVIELQPGLDVEASDFDSVFLLVRRDPTGPLDYVRKLADPVFPQAFTITPAHSMQGEVTPEGAYQIVARLDRDGDAAAQLGDVQGVSAEPAVAGGPGVRIVLNQVLTGSGEAPRAPGGGSPHAGAGGAAAGGVSPHGAAPVSPHGGALAPFAAGGAGAAAQDPPREPGPRFAGTVELPAEHADRAGKGTLFIIVRSATSGGAPLAVIRRPAPAFPSPFDIGPEHVTLQGLDNKLEILQGKLKLYARLSLSGMATASSGDLESAPLILEADGPPATLVLDQLKP